MPSSRSASTLPYSNWDDEPQDQLKTWVVSGPRRRASCPHKTDGESIGAVCREWLAEPWISHNLLISLGGLKSESFCLRTGGKRTVYGVPGPLRIKGEDGLSTPWNNHPHHSPILIYLAPSTSTTPDTHHQAQDRRRGRNVLTGLPQSSVLTPRCMEDWGGNAYLVNKHKKGLKRFRPMFPRQWKLICTEANKVLIKPKVVKYKMLKSASPKLDSLTHIIHPSRWKYVVFLFPYSQEYYTLAITDHERGQGQSEGQGPKKFLQRLQEKGFCPLTLRIKNGTKLGLLPAWAGISLCNL